MKMQKIYQLPIILYVLFFLVLIVFSSLSIRVVPNGPLSVYDPTIFNLISYTPSSLWFAVSALGALFVFICLCNPQRLPRKLTYASGFAILLIISVVFYGLPHLVEPNPRFVDSWIHGENAKVIIEKGNLDPERLPYQGYPSSFIFLSAFSIVTGVDLASLLVIMPVIFIVLFFSFLTFFADRLIGNPKLAVISALVYGLSTFQLAFHFSPEIFGWLFFILLLAFIAKRINENASASFYSSGNFVTILLLLIGIATTHPVTQFTTILIMLILLVFGERIWKTKFALSEMRGLVILAAVLFSAWALFMGHFYFSNVLRSFEAAFSAVMSDLMSSIAAQPIQVYSPPEVANLLIYKRILYITTLLVSFFGGYFLWKRRRRKSYFLLVLFIASGIAAPLTLIGALPLERALKLAFIPLSILSACLILERRKSGALILTFILLTIPVNFASLYWNELGRKMTFDWETDSARFIASNFHGVLLSEFRETGIQNFYGNFSRVYNDYYLWGKRPDVFNHSFIEEKNIELVYITQLTILKESWSGKELDINSFLDSPFFNCISSNEYSLVLIKNRNGS